MPPNPVDHLPLPPACRPACLHHPYDSLTLLPPQELRGRLEEERAGKEAAQAQLRAARDAHAAALADERQKTDASLQEVGGVNVERGICSTVLNCLVT